MRGRERSRGEAGCRRSWREGQGRGDAPRRGRNWRETRSGPGTGDASLLDHTRPQRAIALASLQTLTFSSALLLATTAPRPDLVLRRRVPTPGGLRALSSPS